MANFFLTGRDGRGECEGAGVWVPFCTCSSVGESGLAETKERVVSVRLASAFVSSFDCVSEGEEKRGDSSLRTSLSPRRSSWPSSMIIRYDRPSSSSWLISPLATQSLEIGSCIITLSPKANSVCVALHDC